MFGLENSYSLQDSAILSTRMHVKLLFFGRGGGGGWVRGASNKSCKRPCFRQIVIEASQAVHIPSLHPPSFLLNNLQKRYDLANAYARQLKDTNAGGVAMASSCLFKIP